MGRSVGLPAGRWLRWTGPREGIGAAQGVYFSFIDASLPATLAALANDTFAFVTTALCIAYGIRRHTPDAVRESPSGAA